MADTSKITLGQLKTALTQAKNYTDNEIAGITGVSKVEPEELDMPKVFFYGNALPTTKDNVNLTMDYVSNTDKFTSYIKLKCQGTSSMSYAKKNFTLSMFEDADRSLKLKKDFKGWGKQSKFCLKANYVDTTHTRNVSGARIGYDMVKSRPDSAFKQRLLQTPRGGLIDGFPIKLYFNGEFYGIYTWNIPKDGWMFGMDESNPNHIVLCAERNTDGNASLSNSCQFKKLWTDGDGGDWSVEFGTYSTDLQTKFNRVIAFVKDSTDEEFKANISQYLDLYSVIDYYCFSYLCCHLDGLAKNMLMVTYDGNIWGCSLYDMDSIFGVQWNGQSYVASNYQCPEQYQEQFSLLWPKIERCFGRELYQRYLELRRGALSLSNIIKHVEEIYDVIPDRVFADEKAKWTSLPQVNTNTMTRFRNYMKDRAAYVDAEMQAIGTTIPCTGIVLSADTLSFTTTDTQTLTTTVQPSNTTDAVTWSVSPTGIVTVDNGVVTPVANGDCTITATCGSYSDTCSVTVSLPSVECTGITLDKNTLALGAVEGGTTDDSNKNYLENVAWELGTLTGTNTAYNIATSTSDYRCQLTDLPVGTYTLHHDTYTYKKLGLSNNGQPLVGTSASGSSDTNDVTFNITNPNTTVDISVFPNGVTPITGVTLTRTDISDIQEYSFEYTATSSTSWGSQVNPDYLVVEFVVGSITDVDRNKLVNICIGNDIYHISHTTNTNASILNALSNKCNSSKYANNVYVCIALPKSKYGSTLDEFKTYCSNNGISNIYINKNIQSGGATSERLSAQLTATVTPENCTQPVVWSVSPEGIVTVNNGLVAAVSNGEATVTATCGTQTATCAVTVSGMSGSGGDDVFSNAEYALTEARTFNGTSDYIDTGIQLFDTAKDFAVYIDYTPTAGVTQVANSAVFHCIHEVSPYRGLTLMHGDNKCFIGGAQRDSQSTTYLSNISTDNHKFLIQFVNGVISTIKTVDDEYGFIYNSNLATTADDAPYVQVTENLLLGCYQNTSGTKDRYWNGTINKFAVWFRQLTDDEIQQVFNAEYAVTVSTTYTNGYIARKSSHIIDGTTLGAIKETALDISTDFISCTSNDIFVITAPTTTYGSGVVAYDSDKNYLSTYISEGTWSSNASDVEGDIKLLKFKINNIPGNTGYIRLCFNTSDSTLVTIMKVD